MSLQGIITTYIFCCNAAIKGRTINKISMNPNFLEFEQPIAELEAKIEELRFVGDDTEINIGEEIIRLQDKCQGLTESIFASWARGKHLSWPDIHNDHTRKTI